MNPTTPLGTPYHNPDERDDRLNETTRTRMNPTTHMYALVNSHDPERIERPLVAPEVTHVNSNLRQIVAHE